MNEAERKKINSITQTLNSFIGGSNPEPISLKGLKDNEIKDLAKSLNRLIEKNEQKSKEREEPAFLKNAEVFKSFAKSSLDGILLIGSKGEINYWNQEARDIFNYDNEDSQKLEFHELFAEYEYERIFNNNLPDYIKSLRGTKVKEKHELVAIRKDGRIPVELSISSVKISDIWFNVAFIHNITTRVEKKILESKLQESLRMESIGTLASGIAHDFNNILALVMGYTELAIVDVDKDSILERELKEIYKACLRAKLLVKQIMTYAMQSEDEFIPVQVSTIAKEVLRLLRTTIPRSIEFNLNLNNPSIVMGDPTKIHQIFMNICTNAYQSMGDTGGTLEVELFNLIIPEDQMDGMNKGEYLVTKISDSGEGIEEENLKKIFDPYFTTKEFGKGTGLGLAVVQGIVKSCGGFINAESTLGDGTTFYVYLPVTDNKTFIEEKGARKVNHGSERILIVDDEPALAKLCGELVELLGYKATVYTSSIEALTLFHSDPSAFDLVITDMSMPHMNGDILATELIKLKNDIPIILCTGFSKIMSKEQSSKIGISAFVMKPLSHSELSEQIRAVLDKKNPED
ncbi:MAG: response regulator [Desulfobacterales bacterium]|nr:response regulator [Desulfobacterales bacterium]